MTAENLVVRKTNIDLYAEKCEDGLAKLPEGSVDVVVTSPPYNINTSYNHYVDDLNENEYLRWTDEWVQAVKRVLSPTGSFFLNIAGRCAEPWKAMDVARVTGRHFTLQNTFHWVKSIAISRRDCPSLSADLAAGHFKPVNSDRYVHQLHEYIFQFTHDGKVPLDRLAIGVPYQDDTNVKRWKHGSALRCRGNVWFMPYETVQASKLHPAAFPIKLPWNCIRVHGVDRCQTVLDPMMGSGTTLVAAVLLNIPKAIGFDIDDGYVALAKKWLAQQGGQPNGRQDTEGG